jgi:hypothetical protein
MLPLPKPLNNTLSHLLSLSDRGVGHYFAQEPLPSPKVESVPVPLPDTVTHVIHEDVEQLAPVLRRRAVTPAHIIPNQRDPYPTRDNTPHHVKLVRHYQAVQCFLHL